MKNVFRPVGHVPCETCTSHEGGGGERVLSSRGLSFVSAPSFVTWCTGIRRELV
jgi:hypothetical protein